MVRVCSSSPSKRCPAIAHLVSYRLSLVCPVGSSFLSHSVFGCSVSRSVGIWSDVLARHSACTCEASRGRPPEVPSHSALKWEVLPNWPSHARLRPEDHYPELDGRRPSFPGCGALRHVRLSFNIINPLPTLCLCLTLLASSLQRLLSPYLHSAQAFTAPTRLNTRANSTGQLCRNLVLKRIGPIRYDDTRNRSPFPPSSLVVICLATSHSTQLHRNSVLPHPPLKLFIDYSPDSSPASIFDVHNRPRSASRVDRPNIAIANKRNKDRTAPQQNTG